MADPQRPNILFIFPDQLRAAEIGINGGRNVETPNLDRLAREGVNFTNGISTCPVCTPYRAMLQTGRLPTMTGAVINSINVYSKGDCLADVFSRAGYDTGYIGKWHIMAGYEDVPLRQNSTLPIPQTCFVPPGPLRMGWQFWAVNNFSVDYLKKPFYYRDTPEKQYWNDFETDGETTMAIDYMRSHAKSGKPFFLTVAPHPPHAPWRADQAPQEDINAIPKDLYWRPNVKGPRGSYQHRYYYAMIHNVDRNVGRILKFLDESGLARNTIVVFTSDHGEMGFSHNLIDKKYPYAEAVDVPLLIRWPARIRPGSRSDALFTPMDHFPTLASLAGVTAPKVDGIDLSSHVLKQNGPKRDSVLMANYSSTWDYCETMTSRPEWRAVRTPQHTYIRWLHGPEELYDNMADPYQVRNLADTYAKPAALAHLQSRLKDLLHDSHDEFPPGTAYSDWFNHNRDIVRNALGPFER